VVSALSVSGVTIHFWFNSVIVFHHIPRTGGTFLIEKLRQTSLGCGPTIEFSAPSRFVPRVLCNQEYRPVMLIYHTSGKRFERDFHRRPGDFVFTFLRNRVDMVYSNFAYMRMRIRRGDKLNGWTDSQHRYFERSIEEHVDGLLAADEPDSEYPCDLKGYDFVGITEEMSLSLRVLNKLSGTALVNDEPINSVSSEKMYRRQDLEHKFAEQMELFRRARALLQNRAKF
jgi:hypothetical protein